MNQKPFDTAVSEPAKSLAELKARLGDRLQPHDRIKRPDGVPTGNPELDGRLLWGGFPKGEMTLLLGELGTGSTSLWIEAADGALRSGKWVAWIDGDAPLCPTPLRQRGVDLSRLLVTAVLPPVQTSPTASPTAPLAQVARASALSWLRVAQELLASSLFETVGSGSNAPLCLRESQARKLLASCRAAHCALVLVATGPAPSYAEMFALIGRFEKNQLVVDRARPRSPFTLPRRVSHATFSRHSRATTGGARGLPSGEPHSITGTHPLRSTREHR